jgi:hypothetical protein
MLGQGRGREAGKPRENAFDTTIDTSRLDDRARGGLNHALLKRALLVLAVLALYVLHQDVWLWRSARPLVFGFVPVGLFYHACFSLAVSALMWLLVTCAWPSHLEEQADPDGEMPTR